MTIIHYIFNIYTLCFIAKRMYNKIIRSSQIIKMHISVIVICCKFIYRSCVPYRMLLSDAIRQFRAKI